MKQKTIKIISIISIITLLPFADFSRVFGASSPNPANPKVLRKSVKSENIIQTKKQVYKDKSDTESKKSFESVKQPERPELPNFSAQEAKSDFGYRDSIAGLPGVAEGNIVVASEGKVELVLPGVSDLKIQNALNYIYKHGDNKKDYLLFIGGNFLLSSETTSKASNTGNNFASLKGHARSLTITSSATDSDSDAKTITTSSNKNIYFGLATVLKNIKINGTNNYFAQGNPLALKSGTDFLSDSNIYGGSDVDSDISGDSNLFIDTSLSRGTLAIYGGNKSGGTISGSTHVTIKDGNNFSKVSAGNEEGGVIEGNTNLSIKSFRGKMSDIDGAGKGSQAKPVTIKGNVYNEVNSTNPASTYSGTYYGGVEYGTIEGTIYNRFVGQGKYYGHHHFNGGSQVGRIRKSGSQGLAIVNQFDTSHFGGGGRNMSSFGGIAGADNSGNGNFSKGKKITTYGNVVSYVKTGYGDNPNSTHLGGAAGAYGSGYVHSLNMPISSKANDADEGASAAREAESKADEKLYGDAYIWLQGGLVGDGYTANIVLGGGYGFIKGRTVLEVGDGSTAPGGEADNPRSATHRTGIGGTGYVAIGPYSAATSRNSAQISREGYTYSKQTLPPVVNIQTLGDLVGAGGNDAGNGSNYWQIGDSYLIQNNSAARWTYGGTFSGNHIGNSYNINNGSVVDTLEGADYGNNSSRIYGSSFSQMNNGQVNWFFSGGGWSSAYISGNMTTIAYNGVINANTGGNYAAGGGNVTKGNSSVYLYGGDFSGQPRTDGPKRVCGANFNNSGSVLGNSSLTLDLTGPSASSFEFSKGNSYLSAGAGYKTTKVVTGTDENNTIDLTIRADAKTADKLASATIFGDGSNSANTKVGTINMTIDAPGAKVGNVYASLNNLVAGGKIKRNVHTKITEGSTIVGDVYNSSENDNYTSQIANAGSKVSTVVFEKSSDNANNPPVTITGKVVNFTSAEVKTKVKAMVEGGLLNGKAANATNHASAYAKSGSLTLGNASTLGVNSDSSIISASELKVGAKAEISSPYTEKAGLMNFSDLQFTNDGGLTWIPTGTVKNPSTEYHGAYWGAQKAFPVLTFNGGDRDRKSGAANITPANFQGVDLKNNYAFLGDYTLESLPKPSSPTWIGYVVPGQIRVLTTSTEHGELGTWKHYLKDVKTGNPVPGEEMKAWADTKANESAQTIRLMYTMNYSGKEKPAYHFDSEKDSYITKKSATSYSGKLLDEYSDYKPDFQIKPDGEVVGGATRDWSTNDYFTGNQRDGSNDQASFGSYIILSTITDNKNELKANNYIISDKKAKSLRTKELEGLLAISGKGLVDELKLDEPTIQSINRGINGEHGGAYRNQKLSFSMGDKKLDGNLIIVPNSSVISEDGQVALDAYDSTLDSDEAHAISDAVNSVSPNEEAKPPLYANGVDYYTKALGFKADGRVENPELSNVADLIKKLQNIEESEVLPANYSYNKLHKKVNLNIHAGTLSFTSAPSSVDFATQKVSSKKLTARANLDRDVIVTDTRSSDSATEWRIMLSQTSPIKEKSGRYSLSDCLVFNDGSNDNLVNSDQALIYDESSKKAEVYKINSDWSGKKGLFLKVPVQEQKVGDYEGTLTWRLETVPEND